MLTLNIGIAMNESVKEDSLNCLFSLDVLVNWVRFDVPSACRIPAVSFHLLDFPPVMVHHVSLERANELRRLPATNRARFNLLCDATPVSEAAPGAVKYSLRRGKSALFRMSPSELASQLSEIPLYVSVIDVWNEIQPKIIGSFSVSLHRMSAHILHSVNTAGSGQPVSAMRRNDFSVFNLMGSEIGAVSLQLRLQSLGSTIASHFAHDTITTHASETSNDRRQLLGQSKATDDDEKQDISLENCMKSNQKWHQLVVGVPEGQGPLLIDEIEAEKQSQIARSSESKIDVSTVPAAAAYPQSQLDNVENNAVPVTNHVTPLTNDELVSSCEEFYPPPLRFENRAGMDGDFYSEFFPSEMVGKGIRLKPTGPQHSHDDDYDLEYLRGLDLYAVNTGTTLQGDEVTTKQNEKMSRHTRPFPGLGTHGSLLEEMIKEIQSLKTREYAEYILAGEQENLEQSKSVDLVDAITDTRDLPENEIQSPDSKMFSKSAAVSLSRPRGQRQPHKHTGCTACDPDASKKWSTTHWRSKSEISLGNTVVSSSRNSGCISSFST